MIMKRESEDSFHFDPMQVCSIATPIQKNWNAKGFLVRSNNENVQEVGCAPRGDIVPRVASCTTIE